MVLLTEDRFDEAMNFLKIHYIEDEPCARASGQKFTPDLKRYSFQSGFNCGLTVMMLEPGTNKIIAILVTDIEAKHHKEILVPDFINDEALKRDIQLENHVSEIADIFQKLGIDEILHFQYLSVHRNYRNQGVASQLLGFCLKMYEYLGISPLYAKVLCTSNYSRKVFEKNGFERVCGLNYNEYYVDGVLVYPKMQEHTSCTYLVKRIM